MIAVCGRGWGTERWRGALFTFGKGAPDWFAAPGYGWLLLGDLERLLGMIDRVSGAAGCEAPPRAPLKGLRPLRIPFRERADEGFIALGAQAGLYVARALFAFGKGAPDWFAAPGYGWLLLGDLERLLGMIDRVSGAAGCEAPPRAPLKGLRPLRIPFRERGG